MKIVTWNCAGKYREKRRLLEIKNPDIEIIQESEEHIDNSKDELITKEQYSKWIGLHKSKGVRITSKLEFRVIDEYSDKYRIIVPLLFNYVQPFIVFAIWTQKGNHGSYTQELLDAISHYKEFYDKYPCFFIGDFNSNQYLDSSNKYSFHMKIVELLKDSSISSVYHTRHEVSHGNEIEPTFFLHKKINRPFHIDYCFCHDNLMNRITKFEIGKPEYWLKYSDHMPIEMNIEI